MIAVILAAREPDAVEIVGEVFAFVVALLS